MKLPNSDRRRRGPFGGSLALDWRGCRSICGREPGRHARSRAIFGLATGLLMHQQAGRIQYGKRYNEAREELMIRSTGYLPGIGRVAPGHHVAVAILILTGVSMACRDRDDDGANPDRIQRRSIQTTPPSSLSPGGSYRLVIENGLDRYPKEKQKWYWYVRIEDPVSGRVLYREENLEMVATSSIYRCWETDERFWIRNSDDGRVYFWERTQGEKWRCSLWGFVHGDTAECVVERELQPPDSILPKPSPRVVKWRPRHAGQHRPRLSDGPDEPTMSPP